MIQDLCIYNLDTHVGMHHICPPTPATQLTSFNTYVTKWGWGYTLMAWSHDQITGWTSNESGTKYPWSKIVDTSYVTFNMCVISLTCRSKGISELTEMGKMEFRHIEFIKSCLKMIISCVQYRILIKYCTR